MRRELTNLRKGMKSMFVVVFIAVFGSSIIGATLFGVSLNKLVLVPLEIYLLFQNGRNLRFQVGGRQKKLISWYIVACLGSLSGILFSVIYNTKVTDELIQRAGLQIFSYLFLLLPVALMLWNSRQEYEYAACFRKALIWTARIQTLWGIAQFALMQTIRFDLNSIVLGGVFGGDWTRYSNIANSSVGVVMRVTGINRDAAFLGLLLLLGFILETKPIHKFLYVVCALLALSRVALVSIVFIVLYQLFIKLKSRTINNKALKKSAKYGAVVIILIIVFVRIYWQSPALQQQIIRVLERFSTVITGEDGTNRHIGYPIAVVQLELFNIPLIQKFVGVGNQCGGILMSYYSNAIQWLGLASSMLKLNYVWTVESDIASVFLETGIIGGILYYSFFYKCFRAAGIDTKKRSLVLGLAVFGVMYNMAGGSFIQLVYISLFATDYVLTEDTKVSINGAKRNKYKRKLVYNSGELLQSEHYS